MGGQRKGGLFCVSFFFFFNRFIILGLLERKTENRNQRAIIDVGEKVFMSPKKRPSFRYGFPPPASICPMER